uniref:Saccharopine dehydrogenase n=1 Tax=Leptobrachium leishanense TaxID=445787 RepID=A0A8C5P6K3_9ANUR
MTAAAQCIYPEVIWPLLLSLSLRKVAPSHGRQPAEPPLSVHGVRGLGLHRAVRGGGAGPGVSRGGVPAEPQTPLGRGGEEPQEAGGCRGLGGGEAVPARAQHGCGHHYLRCGGSLLPGSHVQAEQVVRACVENGAHFVDISGEPQYLETMCLKYDQQAAENGVYIVGSTGFDSIPADLGVIFTRDSLKGTLTAVESILTFKSGPLGTCIHNGTWQSAIHGIADQGNLKKLRKQLAYKPLPVVGRKLKRRSALSYSGEVEQYTIPFLGADASVVKRSQRYLHEYLQETPVQYSAYAAVGGLFSAVKLIFAGLLFAIFTKFCCGRNLLIKFPRFFSFGYFSSEGPTQQQMDQCSFEMTFFGEGYSPGKDPQQGAPDLKICTRVSGPEAAYVTTPIAMVQAAVAIQTEPGSLPKNGGVFGPAAAFSKTKIIERMDKRGLRFLVVSRTEA